jgi:hypothetical protein
MKCGKCKFWKPTGSYDSGPLGLCEHPQITGNCHPSYGYDNPALTMMILSRADHEKQLIYTRYRFGCIMFAEADE